MTDPTEKWRQNHRDLQARLLQTGVLDEQALLNLRGDVSPGATSAWVQQQGCRILVVDTPDGPRYPSFQFTPAGQVRPELAPHIAALQDAGVGTWMTWVWLTEPTGLLTGAIPQEVLVSSPARGVRAVQRRAEQAREEQAGRL